MQFGDWSSDVCSSDLIPRWPFDKFENGERLLGTQMKATGEVMAIGRNIEERSEERRVGKECRSRWSPYH